LEDLDESVRVVESTGDRWGIGPDEVSRRRGFVERVKKEVRVRNEWTRPTLAAGYGWKLMLMLMRTGVEG
jgi:syntaxin 6